jgi:F-type H+-transporting ATPase subunit beta
MNQGKIIQIIGPVVDVEFNENEALPEIYHALKVQGPKGQVVLEVVKHLNAKTVKTISLQSTDGLQRGLEVQNTGKQIEVPVGSEVLGNIFNVVGQTLNKAETTKHGSGQDFKQFWPIHRLAPAFVDQSTKTEVFETGIKVIDLIAPFIKGGKIIRRSRCRKNRIADGTDQKRRRRRRGSFSVCGSGRANPRRK